MSPLAGPFCEPNLTLHNNLSGQLGDRAYSQLYRQLFREVDVRLDQLAGHLRR